MTMLVRVERSALVGSRNSGHFAENLEYFKRMVPLLADTLAEYPASVQAVLGPSSNRLSHALPPLNWKDRKAHKHLIAIERLERTLPDQVQHLIIKSHTPVNAIADNVRDNEGQLPWLTPLEIDGDTTVNERALSQTVGLARSLKVSGVLLLHLPWDDWSRNMRNRSKEAGAGLAKRLGDVPVGVLPLMRNQMPVLARILQQGVEALPEPSIVRAQDFVRLRVA